LLWREDFIINKIGAHTVNMETVGARYALYFSSRSFVNSMKKNLFKSYKNISLADAVKSMFNEMSKNDLMIEDPRITLTTPFISTGLMPHKAIEAMAHRACSNSKYYLFFERFFPVVGTYADGKAFAASHFFGSYDKLVEDSTNYGVHNIFFDPNQDAKIEPNYIRAARFTKKDNFIKPTDGFVITNFGWPLSKWGPTVDVINTTRDKDSFAGFWQRDMV
jgi:hypothetical protein